MADLKERLTKELKDALKAGEKVRLGALRMLSAAVKNREIELRRELTDEEFVEVASREVKKRKESVEAFDKGGRPELSAKEREEQGYLETYLPEGLSDDEVKALVDEAVTTTGATGAGDLGKVMGYVMGKAKGRVDGTTVNRLVRERLES